MTTDEFNLKYQSIANLLFLFAMKLTKNKNNADDLIQETICKAFKSRDRFCDGTNFKAWMTTIMRNNFINDYRKKKTRNKIEGSIEDYEYLVESKSVDGNAHSFIMIKELNKMVNSLSDDFQEPFEMYNEGYHYDEIADKMKIPIGTVKSRIYFARKKLRVMVQEHYGTSIIRRA